ncbi:crystallin [Methanoculleus taiwanensis]|uniref:Crystallin n=1 Tax=Methanoculleus taiwanensis TaxID=1550565 RepID=A0A498H1R1_9EURY|nr:ADP-ribosylglycohydrolase family protein [Methanoculleus taiwanensis]RXE56889.1 crystallin [Methanoculleus taiwanensis]
MLDQFKGCLLGAAIGDALGMAGESGPPSLQRLGGGYRRAWRGHPNAGLKPGQFTDDTQMMLMVAELLADGTYTDEAYAANLARMYMKGEMRFADGSVGAACEHLLLKGPMNSGVNSNTSGCVSIGIPFALLYDDPVEVTERVVTACSITHTHPAAHAGAVTVAMLIHYTIRGYPDALELARRNAMFEDAVLGNKIRDALRIEREGISLESALSVLGNDVTVHQTVPLAFFLASRITDVDDLLSTASNVGGNTDTIALICGAYAGAKYGKGVFRPDLTDGLEDRGRIENIANRLYQRYTNKD